MPKMTGSHVDADCPFVYGTLLMYSLCIPMPVALWVLLSNSETSAVPAAPTRLPLKFLMTGIAADDGTPFSLKTAQTFIFCVAQLLNMPACVYGEIPHMTADTYRQITLYYTFELRTVLLSGSKERMRIPSYAQVER
jgi:hypothetical protein